jgi:hypothetical protein
LRIFGQFLPQNRSACFTLLTGFDYYRDLKLLHYVKLQIGERGVRAVQAGKRQSGNPP